MSYLGEFKKQIDERNFHKFLQLWEEYCTNDEVDVEELISLLHMIKESEFAETFGEIAETALPLWESIENKDQAYEVLKQLIDIQTTNSPLFADVALSAIKEKYKDDPYFNERIRLIGLRHMTDFQGALSNYDLLDHMEEGKCVFHKAGWGTGEILSVSPIREEVILEFEHLTGKKSLTFTNAFKTLRPLPDDHFLARRFADPDRFEAEARKDPVGAVKLLLRDLGPMTASEIKDEMCELVIPDEDWTKWWQTARNKLKKDTMVAPPTSVRDPFVLRDIAVSHGDRLHQAIQSTEEIDEIIQASYSFVRDLPQMLKDPEVKQSLQEKLTALLEQPHLTKEEEIQILLFLEQFLEHSIDGKSVECCIKGLEQPDLAINRIEIVALKKRALEAVRKCRDDWDVLFSTLIFSVKQNPLRDYILKELTKQEDMRKKLTDMWEELLHSPLDHPETLFWYFQKTVKKGNRNLPFCDKEGQCLFFESFLVLLHSLDSLPRYRDLLKKMYTFMIDKRYAVVRTIFEGASLEHVKESLLIASKCHILTNHDRSILQSLAAVVHPSLGKETDKKEETFTLWTTEEGYRRTQDRVKHIGTVEVVENAREVEAARALGDLRENSEYKFAVERRGQLQRELKQLSEQLSHARIITKQDIDPNTVSIGSIVTIKNSKGNGTSYTILGPWEADPDAHILSFQSEMAKAMLGIKKGGTFSFRNETFTINDIKSYLEG